MENEVARSEPPASGRRPIRRFVEFATLGIGLLLLVFYGVAMLHQTFGSRAAIRAFEAQSEKPRQNPPDNDGAVDFSLWSEKRIRGYLDSLNVIKDEPMAVLAVSRLQIQAPVFAGTDELVLNRGLGWIRGTPKPGDKGNSGIAGHRDGFFRALKDIAVGDAIELKTRQAKMMFRVDEIEIVAPEDVGVLSYRGTISLTLVTCYPFYFVGDAPQRFIVHARLEQQSATNFARISGFPVL
jgi:sortase A